MARKKQTAKEQAQGLGCLVVIGLAVVVYATSNKPAPTPRTESYGRVIDAADERVIMPADVVFYQCQQLSCPEAGTIAEGQRVLITKMISGEVVNGIELWVVAEDSDGNEAYAPMVYVFPPTPTPEATNEK